MRPDVQRVFSSSHVGVSVALTLNALPQALELLKVELEHSMALSGCCNLAAITKDLLVGPGGYGCQSKL